MDFHGTRMRSCGVSRRGSGGTFALGRPVFAAMRLRYGGWDCCEPKRKKTARSTHGERHHGRCARPRQPITLHPRRGCAKRKPSRTISRPESRHSCTTSQTTSATGPRKRRFSNAPTRKRKAGRIEQHDRTAQTREQAAHSRRGKLPGRERRAHARLCAHQVRHRERMVQPALPRHVPAR